MRSRLILALVGLSLVAGDVAAQRVRQPPSRRRPDQPAPKPPLAPGLHDPRLFSQYKLSRFSAETYPMFSYMQTTGLFVDGVSNNYVSFGDGTQLSFRVSPSVFITTDLTSTARFGNPFGIGTAEFGVRIKPWTGRRITPFMDARASFAYTASNGGAAGGIPFAIMYHSFQQEHATGSGKGGIFGVGLEAEITQRFGLTAGLTHARFDMRGRTINTFDRRDYGANATRLAVGLRYNHGRWIAAPR
jgi:hypothetical protein